MKTAKTVNKEVRINTGLFPDLNNYIVEFLNKESISYRKENNVFYISFTNKTQRKRLPHVGSLPGGGLGIIIPK